MAPHNPYHQRVTALAPRDREALAQQLCQLGCQLEAAPSPPSSQRPSQRLVAYVVTNDAEVQPSALRDSLKAKLPKYMVPAAIVPLATLPRTANGKIDTNALPEPPLPVSSLEGSAVAGNPVEKTLANIWCNILGLETLGIHDNFFELGGDSILSIQIVSQAREAGLRLAPNQLFEQPTIAELAAVVNLVPERVAIQGTVTGPLPLTPIQHWFFEQGMAAPHHWHQARLFELPVGVDRGVVERAISTLWHHHDALRLRFSQDSTGWQQHNGALDNPPILTQKDLSHLSGPEQRQAVSDRASELHASVNLAAGGLMSAAYFIRGEHEPSWLLMSIHHLAVDAVSWQILQRDLATLLEQQGGLEQQNVLPAKTTAFKTWAETLAESARNFEANFWASQVELPVICLPQEASTQEVSTQEASTQEPTTYSSMTEATARSVTVGLNATDTQSLLQAVPAVYNTQINDVLLTALTQTLLQWSDVQSGSIRVDLEAHGREATLLNKDGEDVVGMDVSRTVGWFTTTYPVRLQLSMANDCEGALKSVKEQLRQIPDRGIGYGMVRYWGDPDSRRRLAKAQPSEVLFNYLGQQLEPQLEQYSLSRENSEIREIQDLSLGVLRDPRNRRSYSLEINTWVAAGQLQCGWRYDRHTYLSDTILSVANTYLSALKNIIAHCLQVGSGGFTPSDFPDADLSQNELDSFIDQLTQEA